MNEPHPVVLDHEKGLLFRVRKERCDKGKKRKSRAMRIIIAAWRAAKKEWSK